MATVIINGRTLQVWDRQQPGGLGKSRKVAIAEKTMAEAAGKPSEFFQRLAELVHCYVGNEETTVDWLLDNLPQDCGEILKACVEATGMKLAGEVKRP